MSGVTTPAAASTTGPKVSMFGAKTGFVIPKNKLSGSLVPILRGSNKQKDSGKASEESTTQVQRKTKWGPDLTQDADVRKGRALAYQTRVDQITQQLKSGSLVVEDNQESPKTQHLDDTSSSDQIESESPELLELERREIIGEILKLNPSYKAPLDYKPLLKEARVPIPVNQYPGYNFVSLIYGPGSDTKMRLEKETGSKLQVYGTKRNTGEKVEITPSNGNDIVVAYEDLHVHVSAETFEKVDSAVALIEMLLNSVSGNLVPVATSTSVSGDNVNALTQSQEGANLNMAPAAAANQGLLQNPVVDPTQGSLDNQFRYPGPWFPNGPPQTSMYPPSGFIPPSSSSAPYPNNPSNLPSHFGARPTSSTGFNSIPQNPSFLPQRPNQPSQGMQHQYTPQPHPLGPPVPPAQFSSAPPTMLPQPPFAGSQAPSAGPHLSGRPHMPPHPGSNAPPGPPPSGSSVRWSGSPAGPLGPPPTNVSTGNMAQLVFFLNRPQLQSTSVNHPPSLAFGSGPVPPPASGHYPSQMPSTVQGPPIQSGMQGSISVSTPNFTPLRPPQRPLPRSQLPGSGDFTFQPNQSQNSASQTFPRLSNHHIHNMPPSNPMVHPSAPQAPPFQFTVHNQTSQSGTHMYSRPQISNQIGQAHGPTPRSAVPFSGNPNVASGLPRLPAFPNSGPVVPTNPIPQMGPRHYGHQMPNLPGSFPPRPVQNFPVWPGNYMPPNQQFSRGHPFASDSSASSLPRGMQNNDPFLPTARSIVPQQQAGRKQENDVEYEDLMASVGVK